MLNDPRPIRDGGANIKPADIKALTDKFPKPPQFETNGEIEALDHDGALNVLRHARRMLLESLIGQEHHEHMTDDCGDYLTAAMDGFQMLFVAYEFSVSDEDFVAAVKQYLRASQDDETYPWGACDGEARYDFLSDAMIEGRYTDV